MIKRSARNAALLLLLVLPFLSVPLPADENPSLVKAAFVYNFAKFTRWPKQGVDAIGENFTICYTGTDDVATALEQLSGQKIKNRSVQVRAVDQLDNTNACQLLYVAQQEKMRESLENYCCQPMLLVSQLPGFVDAGGMIEIVQEEASIRFKINLNAVKQSSLSISSRLLILSEIVNGGNRP